MSNKPFHSLIQTPVVPVANDAFWNQESIENKGFEPKPVLVVAPPSSDTQEERQMMEKILTACQLSTDDYNLLWLPEGEKLAWHTIKEAWKVRTVILFGIEPSAMGIQAQFMPHQTSRFSDCNWLYTATVRYIMEHPEIKAHLWNYGLKPVFIDKIYP